MAKITLKINGKPFERNVAGPAILKLKAFLENAPKDELFTSDELQARVGIGEQTLLRAFRAGVISPEKHRQLIRKKFLYGSAAAIAELRSQIAE